MVHPLLKAVSSHNQFWVADGRSLKNLEELAGALQDMDETTFRQHVNAHKNDFHSWVRDVHQDKKLAGTLLKIKQKEHTFHAIQKRIQELLPPENSLQQQIMRKRKNDSLKRNAFLKNTEIKQHSKKKLLARETVSMDIFSKNSWHSQSTVLVIIVGALLAVAFVGTASHAVVTGAAVGGVVGRGAKLIGITLLTAGILFIVAAVRKPKLVEKLSTRSHKNKSKIKRRKKL
ncbi:hypothetical protein HYX13_03505 [Candidatus Woesearchaeota archaeon]|nr:hypothetical protein [Candidatus Woesearchaeota archaeon]